MTAAPLYTIMLGAGQHNAWRRPLPHPRWLESFEHQLRTVQQAESAGIHGVFLADALAQEPGQRVPRAFEPLTLLAALAVHTSRISFIPTVSTTFTEPYNLARGIASLDNLSGGRFGVNLVTSFRGEENFGSGALPAPSERYARAREFASVLSKLWTSWDEDAVIADAATGRYLREGAVRAIDHQGDHFSVAGPLNIVRSPQGAPGIGQSGSSELGRQLAAEIADFVYTAQPSRHLAEAYATDLRARALASRSDGSRPTVLTGVIPIIADSREDAVELARSLRAPSDFSAGLRRVEELLGGIELSDADPESRIDPAIIPDPASINRRQGRYEIFRSLAVDEGYTIGQLVDYEINTAGHWTIVGTVDDVVEAFAQRYDDGLTDGFNIWPTHYPDGLDRITGQLLPELQRAGYFAPSFDGPAPTFREQFVTGAAGVGASGGVEASAYSAPR